METIEDYEKLTEVVYPKSYEVHENHVAINLTLTELTPDRVQYKPYNLTYYTHLYVQVILQKTEVIEYFPEFLVLTPKGAAQIADQLASAIDDVHNVARTRNKTF